MKVNDNQQNEEGLDTSSKLSNASLQVLMDILKHPAESTQEFLDFALDQAILLTDSKIGYIYHYDEGTQEFTLNSWSKEVMAECKVKESELLENAPIVSGKIHPEDKDSFFEKNMIAKETLKSFAWEGRVLSARGNDSGGKIKEQAGQFRDNDCRETDLFFWCFQTQR